MTENMKKQKEKQVKLPWFGLPRLFPFMAPYKGIILSVILLVLLNGIIDICLPLFQQYAINNFIGKGTLDGLGGFIALYVAVVLIQVISATIDAYQTCQIEMYVGRDCRRSPSPTSTRTPSATSTHASCPIPTASAVLWHGALWTSFGTSLTCWA